MRAPAAPLATRTAAAARAVVVAAAVVGCLAACGAGPHAGRPPGDVAPSSTAGPRASGTAAPSTRPRRPVEAPAPAVEAPAAPTPPQHPAAVTVTVPGFDAALALFPPGRGPHPLVVAAHGAGDSPEAFCAELRARLGDHGVLLCVAGRRLSPHDAGRYFPEHLTLERLVLAARDALLAGHADEVDPRGAVYVAYSQGATMGVLMLPAHGDLFPRLALVEGGFDGWTARSAATFRERGGERVLFVCGRPGCRSGATRSAALLRRAGVEVRVEHRAGGGHTYDGAVGEALTEAWGWLSAGAAQR